MAARGARVGRLWRDFPQALQDATGRPITVADVEIVAEPIFQGALWEVSITRVEDGKLVAVGRLPLQNLPPPEASPNS